MGRGELGREGWDGVTTQGSLFDRPDPTAPPAPVVMVDALFVWPGKVAGAAGRIFGSGKQSCHMTVDGETAAHLGALHAMAAKIGMKRAWFQDVAVMPHYDLTPGRRAAALRAGAVEVEAMVQARARRARRKAAANAGAPAAAPVLVVGPSFTTDGNR